MPLTYVQLEEFITAYIEGNLEPQTAARHIIDYLVYEPPVSTLNTSNHVLMESIVSTSTQRNDRSRKIAVNDVAKMLTDLKVLSTVHKDDPVKSQCYNKL